MAIDLIMVQSSLRCKKVIRMIEFYDREKELEEIMRILNSRPDLITFIYGPINSGKTELIQHLINQLPNDFVVFYVNLRERMIRDYNDFIEALFEIEERRGKRKIVIRELIAEMTKFAGIPISKDLLNLFFKENRPKDAFRYIVDVVRDIRSSGKMPVLIMDELQKIGDVKVDEYLIYELFNLFIRLTKELHSCHVFAVTSDSLFIEKVYAEAMLHGRCRYLLVDDFDRATTENFLKKYGFSEEEIDLTWNYFGGKPVYLVEAIKNRHRLKEFCEEMLRIRIGQLEEILFRLERDNRTLFEEIMEILKEFNDKDSVKYRFITDAILLLVKNNVIFADPTMKILKPQSKLDLLALRRVLEEIIVR